jgi:hypothetical protein
MLLSSFPLISFSPDFLEHLGRQTLGTILESSSHGSTTPHNGSLFFNRKNPNGLMQIPAGLKYNAIHFATNMLSKLLLICSIQRNTLCNKSVKQAFAHLFFVFLFHRPFKASTDNLVMSFPQATLYNTHSYSLYDNPLTNLLIRTLQKTVCLKNNIIPDEIWPKGTDPNKEIDYDLYDSQYSAHLHDLKM